MTNIRVISQRSSLIYRDKPCLPVLRTGGGPSAPPVGGKKYNVDNIYDLILGAFGPSSHLYPIFILSISRDSRLYPMVSCDILWYPVCILCYPVVSRLYPVVSCLYPVVFRLYPMVSRGILWY